MPRITACLTLVLALAWTSATPVSIGITLSTIGFAVFALLGSSASIRARHLAMNRLAYWHSTIASGLHVIVAA